MTEGQGLACNFSGIFLKIIMFKFEDNPFKNNKVTAKNSMNKHVAKYEDNTPRNKKSYDPGTSLRTGTATATPTRL
jgi:hypothetical protein